MIIFKRDRGRERERGREGGIVRGERQRQRHACVYVYGKSL